MIWVAGTTASDERGEPQGGEDAYAQARYILAKIERALDEAGTSLRDVVRTRVVHHPDGRLARGRAGAWRSIRDHLPANTLVQVVGLVGGRVEIEAEAVSPVDAVQRSFQ